MLMPKGSRWRAAQLEAQTSPAAKVGVEVEPSHRLDPLLGQHQKCRLYPLTGQCRDGRTDYREFCSSSSYSIRSMH